MATHDPAPDGDFDPIVADAPRSKVTYVKTTEMRSADDTDTCLRPLGLCELGGSCDSCWYRPDHPRFKKKGSSRHLRDDPEKVTGPRLDDHVPLR